MPRFVQYINPVRLILALALVIGLVVASAGIANAAVVQEKGATRNVQPLRVVDYDRLWDGRLRAYFNNGSVWRAGPCEYETSANCWWDAQSSGSGGGRSFIDLSGTAYYLDGNSPYSFR